MFPHDLETCDPSTLSRRERLWLKAGKRCHWCGCETKLCNSHRRDQATVDHVIPRYKGGSNAEENVVSACAECNQRRNKEDQLGLEEGQLLGVFVASFGPTPVVANRTVLAKAVDTLRLQRDQALAEVKRLRTELELAQIGWKTAQDLRDEAFDRLERVKQETEQMTFRRLLLLKLKRWISMYV